MEKRPTVSYVQGPDKLTGYLSSYVAPFMGSVFVPTYPEDEKEAPPVIKGTGRRDDASATIGGDKGSVTYYDDTIDFKFLTQTQEKFVKQGVMVHLQLNDKAFGFKCTPRFPYINIMKKIILTQGGS